MQFRSAVKSQVASGFTLIELSIVLVIVGLIIGGVLVGRDLVNAATIRAQISQIEKYQTAVNTFQGKYGHLPGDIPDPAATRYGLGARGTIPGEGDGNGEIEGNITGCGNCYTGFAAYTGESGMFWVDLSTAGLIEGGFNTAQASVTLFAPLTSGVGLYLPAARIGNGNYISVWSGGYTEKFNAAPPGDGQNYFGIDGITGGNVFGEPTGNKRSMTVMQAYAIDVKTDDGLPQTGKVWAMFVVPLPIWAGAYDPSTDGPVVAGDGIATAGSGTTCYDNGNVAGAAEAYSMGQNNGAGMNCAVTFQFQ